MKNVGPDSLPFLFNTSGLPIPVDRSLLAAATARVIEGEGISFSLLEAVFVDEDDIVEINREYLGHEEVTDIITFRYDEPPSKDGIEATLYCCAPRILEQADELKIPHKEEFLRIFIHGLLHLAGYDDGTPEQKQEIRRKEDFYLASQ